MDSTTFINSFPGYEFKDGKNIYRDTNVGFGGYIISNPGIYTNVALLDVASLHPHSIIAMNCFGDYTQHFKDLLDARMYIKHDDFESAKKMLNGRLAPYLEDESKAKDLAQALKIAINSVYGLTAASFDNPFRDIRNKNNIVALRGALFMRTLQDEVESKGFKIVAIKTDSIKIANATPEIIQFCMDFAKQYGYTFEHEATYEKMCQVNDADYVAKYKDGKHAGEWTVTGAQFAVPYVFKTLFTKEPITFEDMCETKAVSSYLYLDMDERLPDVSEYELVRNIRNKTYDQRTKKEEMLYNQYKDISDEELDALISEGHDYHFIGKVGSFCPIKDGCGGGVLYREKDGKYYAATGSKGFRWLEAEMVKTLEKEADIDRTYYTKLVDDAVKTISKYGDFEQFISDDPVPEVVIDEPPWKMECGKDSCMFCPEFMIKDGQVACKKGYNNSDIRAITDFYDDNDNFKKR